MVSVEDLAELDAEHPCDESDLSLDDDNIGTYKGVVPLLKHHNNVSCNTTVQWVNNPDLFVISSGIFPTYTVSVLCSTAKL